MNKLFKRSRLSVVSLSVLSVALVVTVIACSAPSTDLVCSESGTDVTCTVGNGASSTFNVEVGDSGADCSLSGTRLTCDNSTVDLASLVVPTASIGQLSVYDSYGYNTGAGPVPNLVELVNRGPTYIEIAASGFKVGESVSVVIVDGGGNQLPLSGAKTVGPSGSVYFGSQIELPSSLDVELDSTCACYVASFTVLATGSQGTTAIAGLTLTDKTNLY